MTALTSERETEGAAYDEKSVHSQAHLLHLHSSSHGRHDIFWHLCASRRPGLFHSYPCTFTWNLLYMGKHYLRKLVQTLSSSGKWMYTSSWITAILHLQQHRRLSLSCLFFSLWPWLHGWNHGLIGCACSEWREGGMCLYWGACGAGTCWCSPIWGFGLWVEEKEVEGLGWGKGMAVGYRLWQWRYFWGREQVGGVEHGVDCLQRKSYPPPHTHTLLMSSLSCRWTSSPIISPVKWTHYNSFTSL